MITTGGLWSLHVDAEAGRPLVGLARMSYLNIRLVEHPPAVEGVPVLRSPQRTIIGWVNVREFLEKHLPR